MHPEIFFSRTQGFLSDFLLHHFDYFCFQVLSSKLLFGVRICKGIKVWFVILQSDSGIRVPARSCLLISCLASHKKLYKISKVSSVMMTLDNGIAGVGWVIFCCFASDINMYLLIKKFCFGSIFFIDNL